MIESFHRCFLHHHLIEADSKYIQWHLVGQLGATEYILNPPRLNDDGGNNDGKILSSVNETGASSSNSQNQLFSNREDFHSAEERFSIGVQLLQNDVIALCFRAGVDVSKLWPAESVLLNLHALLEHCQAQIV